jgi:hypothetical protein
MAKALPYVFLPQCTTKVIRQRVHSNQSFAVRYLSGRTTNLFIARQNRRTTNISEKTLKNHRTPVLTHISDKNKKIGWLSSAAATPTTATTSQGVGPPHRRRGPATTPLEEAGRHQYRCHHHILPTLGRELAATSTAATTCHRWREMLERERWGSSPATPEGDVREIEVGEAVVTRVRKTGGNRSGSAGSQWNRPARYTNRSGSHLQTMPSIFNLQRTGRFDRFTGRFF